MPLRKKIGLLGAILILGLGILAGTTRGASAEPLSQGTQPVVLYFFWREGCPHCLAQKPFLEELHRDYSNLEVRDYEIYRDLDSRILLQHMAAAAGFEANAVPTTFVGDRYWVGYSDAIAQQIRAQVDLCSSMICADAGAGLDLEEQGPAPPPTPVAEAEPEPGPAPSSEIAIPLLGTIDLGRQSLVVSTVLIAFVDGFNPCSLWVLSILISLILRTGSRKRVFAVGMSFLVVTALVYALFIAGLFTIFSFVSLMGWIQTVVAMVALFFAAVNIKDYFWYKEGVSLTISDEQRPGLYRKMRGIMRAESLWGMVAATTVMAVGVALVELPCTAGFPMLWTSLVAGHGVGGLTFGLLLALYMLIYLADELVLFLAAVVTLRSSRLQEKHGRVLKLLGGTLMLTLALVMLINPTLMSEVSSTLLVFVAAIGVALVLLLFHRTLLPLFGIHIGTEKSLRSNRRHAGRAARSKR